MTADDLKAQRLGLKLSQSRLARLSGVSRFKICLHELGDTELAPDELQRIETALRQEAECLRGTLDRIAGGAMSAV